MNFARYLSRALLLCLFLPMPYTYSMGLFPTSVELKHTFDEEFVRKLIIFLEENGLPQKMALVFLEALRNGTARKVCNEFAANGEEAVDRLGTRVQFHVSTTGALAEHYTGKMLENTKQHLNSMLEDTAKHVEQMSDKVDGLTSKLFLKTLPLSSLAVVASAATAYFGSKMLWSWIDRTIRRPKLIIESSYCNPLRRCINWVFSGGRNFVPMIFDQELESRMQNIVTATQNVNTRINKGAKNIKYRNLLLYGPPGTGKTMFAKQLAQKSGMEFVVVSGSSFAKFKKGEGIVAMDELFAWANRSKGLMIFIDEADSVLSARDGMKAESEKYQVLNNFLNYTGERSDKFMIVFATNHMKNLDQAMWRRIDDLVELPLPKSAERERVLKLYCNRILMDTTQNGRLFVDAVKRILTDNKITEIAQKTEGLSNGDLEGIINTIKTDADITDDGLITRRLVDQVVERAVKKLQIFSQIVTA